MAHLSWKCFLMQTSIITLIYLLALFIVQNLQKIVTVDPKLWGCPIFGSKMVYLPQTMFFVKLLISFSSISPFHYAKFQKLLPADPELCGCAILAQKHCFWVVLDYFWLFSPDRDVFQKIQLSHITIDGPLTAFWVSEKNNEPIPRKLTYRLKDERKDRHTLFFRTIMVAASSPPNFRGHLSKTLNLGGS